MNAPPIQVRLIQNADDLKQAFKIRKKVFVEEQQVEARDEYDQFEESSTHYLAIVDGQPVGTARWRQTADGKVKLERFAVLPQYRGKGVGKALVKAVLADAVKQQKPIYLHAQTQVIPFYEKLSFTAEGEIFEEAGILHKVMVH